MDNQQLWDGFAKHILYDMAAGGPDPHMRTVGRMVADVDDAERLWRLGVYATFYNTPGAEVFWQHWPWERGLDGLERWVETCWKGLIFRRERRAVRSVPKLVNALHSYASLARRLPAIRDGLPSDEREAFSVVWREVGDVYGMGRYAGLKLIEALGQYGGFKLEKPGLMAKGAWSPRTTLADLYPTWGMDPKNDSPSQVEMAEMAAGHTIVQLETMLGYRLDYTMLEIYLCDFHQSYHGGRQYPGRSNDSEMVYHEKIWQYWREAYKSQMWDIRRTLMPERCLGEVQGWVQPREGPMTAFKEHGYTWSDLLYDYRATTDFAHPVTWQDPITDEGIRALARKTLSAW